MKDKRILITGANAGIGFETALGLAIMGADIIMICRDAEKGKKAQELISKEAPNSAIDLYIADLSDQEQIKSVCSSIAGSYFKLDVLINNAGFMGYRKRTLTRDGIESTLAVNHLAPFMISNLLYSLITKSENGRIINVSSVVHKLGVFDEDNFQLERKYTAWKSYCNSKLMNVLFTRELSKRLSETTITTNALDPGKVYTEISKTYSKTFRFFHKLGKPFLLTPKQGAKTSIYLASSDEVKTLSGKYYENNKLHPGHPKSQNEDHMRRLWEISEELTKMDFRPQ